MKLEWLHEFVIVAKFQNISKAAKELYLSQSGLSSRITALEKDLGVTLLDRINNKVTLTAAGTIFLEYAQTILDVYMEGREKAQKATQENPPIKISGISPGSQYYKSIANVNDYPLQFVDLDPEIFSLDALRKEVVDVDISCNYSLVPAIAGKKPLQDLEFFPIPDVQGYICVEETHPLAKKKTLSKADLHEIAVSIYNGAYFDYWKEMVHKIIGHDVPLKFRLMSINGLSSLAIVDFGTSVWCTTKQLFDKYCYEREDIVIFDEIDGKKILIPVAVICKAGNANKRVKEFVHFIVQRILEEPRP
jgi:DNA-binding transcriptional LysR family regulator